MPTKRRRVRRQRRLDITELSIDCRYELETGVPFFDGFDGDFDAFKAAWQMHGETILKEFVQEHPGRRPFAWWVLVHKRERPIIRRPPEGEERLRGHHTRYGYFSTHVLLLAPDWGPLQEPEEEYLARLKLLSKEEIAALRESESESE